MWPIVSEPWDDSYVCKVFTILPVSAKCNVWVIDQVLKESVKKKPGHGDEVHAGVHLGVSVRGVG